MEENEQVAGEQQNQPDPIKEKASAQGWVDKESFKGDPTKWVDAETFVKRGEDILPVLKERNEHLLREIQDIKKTSAEFAEFARKSEERAYERAKRELEGKKLQAVQDGDVDTYQALAKEVEELEKDRPQPSTPAKSGEDDPRFVAFKAKNEWYDKDPELAAEADALGGVYAGKGMSYPEILNKVEATIKKMYPEKFANSRREGVSPVEFSTDTGLPKKRNERTYDNLPPEAKEACQRFISRGYVKTKEDYVAAYPWEE